MSDRTEQLAARLETINRELIATIEQLPDTAWQEMCRDEGWTVAATAHHIADSYATIGGLIQAAANRSPIPPTTRESIDKANALNAREYAACDRSTTTILLETNGAAAVGLIRGMPDEQLAHVAEISGRALTVEQMIERVLIGHVQQHFASIRQAVSL